MNIATYFVRRPVMATLLALTVLAFGVGAYRSLPVSDLPNVYYPIITVECDYPGASALTMASSVAAPLEKSFQGLEGLKQMTSKSKPGYTSVELKFGLNRDLQAAAQDVEAAINRATDDLPDDLPSAPTYTKANPADNPILYLTISSQTLTQAELYNLGAERVDKALSNIDGVASVTIWGSKPAVRIQVDPVKLAARGYTLVDLATAIKAGNVSLPAGNLDGPLQSIFLQPEGQMMDAGQFQNLVVSYRQGAPVYLKDLASVIDSVEQVNLSARFWQKGEGAQSGVITLGVQREPGANTVAVAQKVRDALPALQAELPGSLKLELIYDLSVPILASINDVKTTLLIAFVLVVGVIFLFLGRVTDTIIPAVALPASLLLTFVVMQAMGYNLDLLSLMGITMAVGFLVDDAIVVLENTARHMDQGKSPFQAALQGSAEITGTVWSMTMSLAAVFIPLVFMPGLVGRIFQEFAVTIVAAIFCSGLVSVTLTPAMCGRFLRKRADGPGPLERFSDRIVNMLRDFYLGFLKVMLKKGWLAIAIWVFCLVGSVLLFKALPLSFMPKGDSGCILGEIHAPHGTSLALMRAYQDQVEAVLAADPAVQGAFSVIGMGGSLSTNKGFVFATLLDRADRSAIEDVVQRLAGPMRGVVGAEVHLMAMPVLDLGGDSGGDDGAEYSYVLRGSNTAQLYEVSDKFYQAVRKLEGFHDVQTSLDLNAPQLDILIRRDRAAKLGVTTQSIEETLLLAYAGYKVSTIKAATDQYKVILELDPANRSRPADLGDLYVRPTGGGSPVPLVEVADWRSAAGPLEVKHLNQQNEVKISFNLDAKLPLGVATDRLEQLAAVMIPPSISAGFKGEAEEFQKSMGTLMWLMVVALLVMYLVLGVLYESYIHPLTVLSALPVAGFGGVLALVVFRSELSIYAFIGIFMLMGIVKKNGIMMVDFANQRLREGGVDRKQAIYEACQARFRPIVMTGLAAIMGALPIALGLGADGASRQPLGLTVVGGLIFSQMITLFITPVIYLYMEWFQEKVLFRFAFFRPPQE